MRRVEESIAGYNGYDSTKPLMGSMKGDVHFIETKVTGSDMSLREEVCKCSCAYN